MRLEHQSQCVAAIHKTGAQGEKMSERSHSEHEGDEEAVQGEEPTSSERWASSSPPQQQQQQQQAAHYYSDDGEQQQATAVQQALQPSNNVRRWKASPWAVGFTKPTWRDEPLCREAAGGDICSPLCFTACCCPCAGRVGNMVVFAQKKDKLVCVMGPYWMVLLFVTIPFLAAFSIWVAYKKVTEQHLGVVIAWSICTMSMFSFLLITGCRDPGILRRVRQISETSTWRWNDQSLTYRPSHAKYDPECACVIAEFDHTCPWTGTAIGKKNMLTFKLFLMSLLVCIAFNICLLVLL